MTQGSSSHHQNAISPSLIITLNCQFISRGLAWKFWSRRVAFFGDADIDTMLADSGNSITIAGVTKPCLFDQRDEIGLEQDGGAGQIMSVDVATIKTSDFPNVANDVAVVVDGVSYKVWRRLRQGDGAVTELWLRKV